MADETKKPESSNYVSKLERFIDLQIIDDLIREFTKLVNISAAIIDLDGRVLVEIGWQDICTKFFRQSEVTNSFCLESDTRLSQEIEKGTWRIYKCRNNLWDVATPIYIDDEHVANLFVGQFIYSEENFDPETYMSAARMYNFDQAGFAEALGKVPHWGRDSVDKIMSFCLSLTEVISQMSNSNRKLSDTLCEREEILASLTESERVFREYLEKAPYGIFSIGDDLGVISANDTFTRIVGSDASAVLGKSILDAIPESDRAKAIAFFRNIGTAQGNYIELPYVRSGTEPRFWSINAIEIAQGKLLCFALDITQRVQAEAESAYSRDLFASLFNSMVEGVCFHELIFDKNGKAVDYRIIDVNPAYERILKIERNSVVGRVASDAYGVESPYLDVYANVVLTGEPVVFDVNFTPTGRYYSISVAPLGHTGFITIFTDITRNKRNVDELRASEAKFRTVYETMVQGVVISDSQGSVVSANPAAERIIGNSLESMRHSNVRSARWDVIFEDGTKVEPDSYPAMIALRTGEPLINAIYGIRNFEDHKYHWITVNAIPQYRTGEMIPHQVITTFDDFTERKNAEIEMQRQNEYFSAVFDSVNDAIFVIDSENYQILDINARACELYGYTRDELLSKTLVNLSEINSTYTRDLIVERFQNAKAGVPQIFEWRGRNVMGDYFWVEVNVRFAMLGADSRIIITVRDVSDRKKTEAKLLESEKFTRELLSQSPISIQIYDNNGLLLEVNKAWSELWKLDPREVIGKYNILEDSQLKEKGFHEQILKAFSGEVVFLNEVEYDPAVGGYDGRRRYVDVIIFPIIIQNTLTGIVAMHQDTTDFRNYEKELISAKNKAEESDRLKSSFLANMSHEIRTPLNGIIGFTDLLSLPNLMEEERRDFVDVIRQSSYRLMRIVNDLIDVSKIETGQMETNLESFNINFLLNDLLDFHAPLVAANGLTMTVEMAFDDERATIYSDEQKLHQIMLNLISNALKYTQVGSISIGYTLEGNYIRFYVKDTGKGIAPEAQKFIFERFRQEDQSLSRPFEGAGLGLTISKGYVELLGGSIGLESEPNRGSTFFFTIPVIVEDSPAIEPTLQVSEQSNSLRSTIMIAEDDDVSYNYISKTISAYTKYNTLRASNGREAIDIALASEDICMIFMDIRMPVMDGYSAAKQIKAFSPDVPIIALTAFALEGDRAKSLESGCDGYLPKPADSESILRIIKEVLGAR